MALLPWLAEMPLARSGVVFCGLAFDLTNVAFAIKMDCLSSAESASQLFSIQVEHENSEDLAFVFALPSAYEWF